MLYNPTTKHFDVKTARKRYLSNCLLKVHKNEHEKFVTDLSSKEKTITRADTPEEHPDEGLPHSYSDSEDDDMTDDVISASKLIKAFKNELLKKNTVLKETYNRIESLVSLTANTENIVNYLDSICHTWEHVYDQYGRSVLHVAVENENCLLVSVLLQSGVEIDLTEGCGATPPCLAVIKQSLVLVRLLTKYHASVDGGLFIYFPSPLVIGKNDW